VPLYFVQPQGPCHSTPPKKFQKSPLSVLLHLDVESQLSSFKTVGGDSGDSIDRRLDDTPLPVHVHVAKF